MKEFLKLLKISILITVAIVVVTRIIKWNVPFDWNEQLEYGAINFLFAFTLTLVNAYFSTYISKKFSWEAQAQKRLWFGALGSIFLTVLAFGLLRLLLSVVFYGKTLGEFFEGEKAVYYIVALGIALIISLFFHAFYFYRALQENKVKEQKIIAGTASAKFDALKNQLDPHFLFNSLNVLTSLIEEDPKQAQKFTTSLSKVYRYVLEQKNKDLVSVDEEYQFAKTYVKLLKMRFEDSIHFEIPNHSNNPEAKIIPLSLQLLLENAVKHNVVTSLKPLHIKVYEKAGMLVVENNLQEKQVVKKRSGVGLYNIQQRYGILTDRKVEITKSSSEFKVLLPMLTKQVTVMETQQTYIDDKRYKKAKEHVEQLKGFYGNLLAYCIVIPFLAILNYNTTAFPWVIFPAIGWGFGVAVHGMEVFGYNPLWGKSWEERKMREFMEDEDF
ncbi:2TM domain-containing protein [Maribacter polysaccharolyticus]|uniref:2TM domain-containing protein n=1 Tax=Maribacter polysaccharolyticus TaxID=3020831 RepID=UPI00237F776F|nr:2TM domain-containing protein [Maribacter polysaccharolyticus]MDE3740788.1 2TM domain-containing protein [Maribacter polysaccharolyticus]